MSAALQPRAKDGPDTSDSCSYRLVDANYATPLKLRIPRSAVISCTRAWKTSSFLLESGNPFSLVHVQNDTSSQLASVHGVCKERCSA